MSKTSSDLENEVFGEHYVLKVDTIKVVGLDQLVDSCDECGTVLGSGDGRAEES